MNSAFGYRRPDHHCSECDAVFDRPAKLRDHLRRHTGEKPFQCEQCDSAFSRKKDLDAHSLSHVPSQLKPYKCSECTKGFNTRQHLEVHSHVHRRLVCELCKRTFVRQKVFEKHQANHAECTICGKLFKNPLQLGTHTVRQHQSNFKCAECGEAFANKQQLNWHLKKHLRSRKGFLKNVNKQVAPDVRMLTGLEYLQRPVSCEITGCDRRFTREYDLLRHLKKDHEGSHDGHVYTNA